MDHSVLNTKQLQQAAWSGDLKAIQEVIEKRKNVDQRLDVAGNTLLLEAARGGHLHIVKELILARSSVDLPDYDGRTALNEAALYGYGDIVSVLLSSNASVDLADKTGTTPLMKAAKYDRTDIVKKLISSGSFVDLANKKGETALIFAALNGSTKTVRDILSAGASADLAAKDGTTPLIYAASKGFIDIVKELLLSGASVDLANKNGTTPLMRAASYGYSTIVNELLTSGATSDLTDKNGETALMRAKKSKHSNPAAVHLLEKAAPGPTEKRHQFVPVLPRNWVVAPDEVTKKPIYQNLTQMEKSLTPPGYPLLETAMHPNVTFFAEPQQRDFTSSGGHADFDNGVEVTVLPDTVPSGSTMGIRIQPGFAPSDVFVMPNGIRSASPSYLISEDDTANPDGELTVTMEHHVTVSTREEANDLLFLQANSSPKVSGLNNVYEYQEVPEGRAFFMPGRNKGRLTTKPKHISRKFLKVGLQAKPENDRTCRLSSMSSETNSPYAVFQPKRQSVDRNLYTVRVYRSPPHTTGDRLCVIIISLFQRLFFEFLKKFDGNIIRCEYPGLSTNGADRTVIEPLRFVELATMIEVLGASNWRSIIDQELVSKISVDLPTIGNFKPEELHSYPPRMVCQFFPEQKALSTRTTLSLHGFDRPVSVTMALLTPEPLNQTIIPKVDISKLQEAASILKSTASQMTSSQFSGAVERILHLAEKLTIALRLSSLNELADHTETIKTEVVSVREISIKVAEECTRHTISESIKANLSKMEFLSHQLRHVSKVKLNYCKDQEEKTVALSDLVENGADLLSCVNCLLVVTKTLDGLSSHQMPNTAHRVLVDYGEKVIQSLSHEPKAIALRLLSAGFITERVLQETNELNEINADKATRLYTAVLSVVGDHPSKFQEFIPILQASLGVHKDLVEELNSALGVV